MTSEIPQTKPQEALEKETKEEFIRNQDGKQKLDGEAYYQIIREHVTRSHASVLNAPKKPQESFF
jgi:hypothetical protein